MKNYKELIRYLIVGILTTVVSLGSYYILVQFLNPDIPIQLQIANIISWICAVLFAYISNRCFVFRSKGEKSKEIAKFFLSRISTLLIDMAIMFVGVSLIGINDKVVKLFVQVVVTILNYVLGKFMVFRGNSRV